ncbi:hypothetical protein EV586_102318 [Tumebacillus sp. BK434]|nr:hypothetical protein EV586_102318 [Tumebacillus sp. BK434]
MAVAKTVSSKISPHIPKDLWDVSTMDPFSYLSETI